MKASRLTSAYLLLTAGMAVTLSVVAPLQMPAKSKSLVVGADSGWRELSLAQSANRLAVYQPAARRQFSANPGPVMFQRLAAFASIAPSQPGAKVLAQSDLIGYVDGANCDAVWGWVADRSQPNSPVSVDIYDGNTFVTAVVANQSRPDVGLALGDSGQHGFTYTPAGSFADGQPHTLHVNYAGTHTDLINGPKSINCNSASYEGYLDIVNCQTILGWAWDQNHHDVAVPVRIYDGDTLLATVAANEFRQDLADAGKGNGAHAFTYAVPSGLRDGRDHQIHARFDSTTIPLINSPRPFTCPIPQYIGYLEVLDCQRIIGWAADRQRPSEPIKVAIYDGGSLIETINAAVVRSDVGQALNDNGAHGFNIALPAGLKDGLSHNVSVRFEDSSINLSGSPHSTCNHQYEGYVDGTNCDAIWGWAVDKAQLDNPIDVSIYEDNTLVLTVKANEPRPDVGEALGDAGFHGFYAATPRRLKDGMPHTLTVRFEGSAKDLFAAPQTINCQSPSGTAASWIWQPADGPANSWMSFRKSFQLPNVPASLTTRVAVDSKYWLWINGNMVVFEGGLKRGPTPHDTYYDQIELAPFLHAGTNTVAVLVWYWGKDGFSNKDSGKGGLLIQSADGTLKSDQSWKLKTNPAYTSGGAPLPNFRLPESNVRYDANYELPDWTSPGYDDSTWTSATVKAPEGDGPWNNLFARPIPQWSNSGLVDYVNASDFPGLTDGQPIIAQLPYNAQVTPYLKIEAPAGLVIDMRTDNYFVGGDPTYEPNISVRGEYITRAGVQEYESLGWMSGQRVIYSIPAGVRVLALKYRETGYDTRFAGSFACDDPFYESLWQKARRTLYVNMRDDFMDCPDRERAQWWGDVTSDIGQQFYAFDTQSYLLTKKAIYELIRWRRSNGVLYSPVPSDGLRAELPMQMLATIGPFGVWKYYRYSGDEQAIRDAYPAIRDYLSLWKIGPNGLVVHRAGEWDWFDWGTNIDAPVIENCWYFMALGAAIDMANLTGNNQDVGNFTARRASIAGNFNAAFWTGSDYRSPGMTSPDDRANALAVIAGLADSSQWPAIQNVLSQVYNSSPHTEQYVLEALFRMNAADQAFNRIKFRYTPMVNGNDTTLWEQWELDHGGTNNHAWSGGPLTLLSEYAGGIAPDAAGYTQYHVFPQLGPLNRVSLTVPTVRGNIVSDMQRSAGDLSLNLVSPSGTLALVGIPRNAIGNIQSITVNNQLIWCSTTCNGQTSVAGFVFAGEDSNYYKFQAQPGSWLVHAYAQ